MKKAIDEHLGVVEAQLAAYTLDRDPEHLHALRVAIKKLRALQSFLRFVIGKEKSRKALRPLFRDAGVIREIAVTQEVLEAMSGLPDPVFEKLQKSMGIAEKQFLAHADAHVRLVRKFQKRLKLPTKAPSSNQISKFFRSRRKAARTALKAGTRSSLHQCRIAIKELMYVFDALPKPLPGLPAYPIAEVDAFQAQAGAWHDTLMSLHFLAAQEEMEEFQPVMEVLRAREKSQFEALTASARLLLADMKSAEKDARSPG